MKTTKKLLSIFLSFVMLMSITAGIDFSAYAARSGDYEYSVIYDNFAEITKYRGRGGDVEIPMELDGYIVRRIGSSAFQNNSTLKSIKIPDSVISIYPYAFEYCDNLISATIPNSVTDIYWGAFEKCTNLKELTIGSSVKNIGNDAFSCCYNLTDIKIPNSVINIGDYSFCHCENLTNINIPDSVTNIGNNSFSNCVRLKEVTIGNSVTDICDKAFEDCTNLKIVSIGDNVKRIGEYAFRYCENISNIIIPNTVSYIDKGAFLGCKSLSHITIPNSVTSIGDDVFFYCNNLKNISVDCDNKYYSSYDGVLFDKSITELIQYPIGNTRTSYIIPDSVITIGKDSFYLSNNLTSVKISSNLKNINDNAFSVCSNLSSITIPDSVVYIGLGAFSNCESLSKITIENANCIIGDANYTISNNTIIYGHKNSTAQKYAEKYNLKFAIIGLEHIHINNTVVTKATLTKNGKIENKCTDCGNVNKTTTIYYPKTVKLSSNYFTYNGKAQKPSVIVKDSQGTALKLNKDYTVTYSNAKSQNVGKYTVTIKFKGNYSGTKTIGYHITAASPETVKLNRNTFTTNGKVQRPTVTVTDSKGTVLTYKKDFVVEYSNFNSKNVGRYTVTVKMIGNYSGTKTFPYYINPKPTEFVPSNKGGFKAISKGFTLKWNKQASQTTGYQIQYATKRDFSNAATITIDNPNTTSYTSKGRAGNTRYYVRVRTYKKIGNGTFYSNWNSGTKSVVTLK